MANPPEYRRHAGIEPSTQIQPFTEALRGATGGLNLLAEHGRQLAQRAHNELSMHGGIEAAKRAHKRGSADFLLPAFTEGDKAYTDAYKAQEYALALSEGSKSLSRLGFDSLKRPNGQSLLDYDQNSEELIGNIARQLTPENSARIKEVLASDALNQRFKIESKIFERDERLLKENFQNAFEQTIKTVGDAIALGDEKTADVAIETTNNLIDNERINYDWSESTKQKLKEVLKRAREDAEFREEMLGDIADKKAAAKLEELAGLPQTEKNQRKAEVMLNTYKNHLTLTAAHDDLILDGLYKKMNEGSLSQSDVILAKDQLEPNRFADFEVKYAKWLAQNAQGQNIYDSFLQNKNNAMALATLSPKELDGAFDRYVAEESARRGVSPDLYFEAELASGIDAPIPGFNKRLNAGINSYNPKVAQLAAGIYGALSVKNPNSVANVTNDAGQKADTLNRLLTAGTSPEDAVKAVTKAYDELTPAQLKEREELWPIKTKKLSTIDKQKTAIADVLGFNAKVMPEGLAVEFMDVAKNKFLQSGMFDDAWESAAKQFAQVYSQTNINGFTQVMRNAPDRFLPEFEVMRLKQEKADQVFEALNKDFENYKDVKGLYSYRISQNKATDVAGAVGLGLGGLTAGFGRSIKNPIALERRDNDGNITKGILVVMPDKFTDFPTEGVLVSYGMYFKKDGQEQLQPIYDAANNYSNARFDINVKDALAYQERLKSEDAKAAEQLDEHIKRIQAQKAQIIDMRLEAGEDLFYEG